MSLYDIVAISHMVVFFGYAGWIYRQFGVIKSVSTSTYYLEGNRRYWFWAALTWLGLTNLVFVELMEGWAFLATAGIAFAGITIEFRDFGYGLHTGGTAASIIGTFVGIIIYVGIWLPSIILVAGIGVIWFLGGVNRIWWLELWAMLCAGITLLILF